MKLLTTLLIVPIILLAHGDKEHNSITPPKVVQIETTANLSVCKEINTEYITDIKPIFQNKCFDCHATTTVYPWYYTIPGVKQMIDYDIKEAQKHIKMGESFPFVSHETPIKDLQSIREVIDEDAMPPLKYILGHWDAKLTQIEKAMIIKWTKNSILKLSKEEK